MEDQLKNMNLDDSLTEIGAMEDGDAKGETPNPASQALKTTSKGQTEVDKSRHDRDGKARSTDTAQNANPSASTNAKIAKESSEVEAVKVIYKSLPRQQIRTPENREFSMMLKMQGRALSTALMTIAGTRQRSGRLWLTCFVTLVVISLLITLVYYKHCEINLGYELSAAIAQREALLEENRMLRIELRVQSRRDRLEPLAGKELGMSVIRPEQVLIVDMKNAKKKTATGTRQDGLDDVKRIGEKSVRGEK